MRFMLLVVLVLSLQMPTAQAQTSCDDSRTTMSKIYDKLLATYDDIMPVLLQDPERSVHFHLLRSKALYLQAKETSTVGNKIRLAILGEHQLTLLEKNIRQIQNPKNVPFEEILRTLDNTTGMQNEILSQLPSACAAPIKQLQSFEIRTTTVMKKLYYESLLP